MPTKRLRQRHLALQQTVSWGANMTASDPSNTEERRRLSRLEIARLLYEALVAQDPNRAISLCDEAGKVVARHDPLPEHDAPGIASNFEKPPSTR